MRYLVIGSLQSAAIVLSVRTGRIAAVRRDRRSGILRLAGERYRGAPPASDGELFSRVALQEPVLEFAAMSAVEFAPELGSTRQTKREEAAFVALCRG